MINITDNNFVFGVAAIIFFVLFAFYSGASSGWMVALSALMYLGYGYFYMMKGWRGDNANNFFFGWFLFLIIPVAILAVSGYSADALFGNLGNILAWLGSGLAIGVYDMFGSLAVLLIFFAFITLALKSKPAANTTGGVSLNAWLVAGLFIIAFIWPGVNAFANAWSYLNNTMAFQLVLLGLVFLAILHLSDWMGKQKIGAPKFTDTNLAIYGLAFVILFVWPGVSLFEDLLGGVFASSVAFQAIMGIIFVLLAVNVIKILNTKVVVKAK